MILGEFQKASKGSLSVVYLALKELSQEKGTRKLDATDVSDRIRAIMEKRTAGL